MEILTLAAGIAIGSTLAWAHGRSVRLAVQAERRHGSATLAREIRRNQALSEELRRLEMAQACADAHRLGREHGRGAGETTVEGLARTFGGKTVKFGSVQQQREA